MTAVGKGRIVTVEQFATWGKPAATPVGVNVPTHLHSEHRLQFLVVGHRQHIELGLLAVVAHQHLAALQGPHLYGATFAVGIVPEIAPRLCISAYRGSERGNAVGKIFGVDASHPLGLLAGVMRHALEQIGHVQVVHLTYDFAVTAQGVDRSIHEEPVYIHLVHRHLLGAQGLVHIDSLHTATRDEEFLERAAVEFVKAIHCPHLLHALLTVLSCHVLRTEPPHDGFNQLPQYIVGDRRHGAIFAVALPLGHASAVSVTHHIAPLVAVGEALVAQTAAAQCMGAAPRLVGSLQHRFVFVFKVVFHDEEVE